MKIVEKWRVGHPLGDSAAPPLGEYETRKDAEARLEHQRSALNAQSVDKSHWLWDYRIQRRLVMTTPWEEPEDE